MNKTYQACRVCGVRIPAGFTNCDNCYHKTDKVKAEEVKPGPVCTAGSHAWIPKITPCI